MKKVYIIILHFKGKDNTLACLESCQKIASDGFEFKLVVVDNNSGDNIARLLKDRFSRIQVIKNRKNFGYAKGNNIGLQYALKHGADYCLILNNDTIVSKSLLVQLIKVMENNQQVGIVSPKIFFASGYEFHKNRYKKNERGKVLWYAGGLIDWDNIITTHRGIDEVDKGKYNQTEETGFCTGCCMLIKNTVLNKIGLFDEKYFLYWEDVDLCQKAKLAGFKTFFCSQTYIYHKNAGSSAVGSNLQDYYQTRNRLLFGMRYARVRVKVSLFKESIYRLVSGREWEKKGIIDFYINNFKQGRFKNV